MYHAKLIILSKLASIAALAVFCWALSLATHSNNWIIFAIIETTSWNMMGREFLELYPLFNDGRSHHLNGMITIAMAKVLGIKNYMYELNAVILAFLIHFIASMAHNFFSRISNASSLVKIFVVSFIFINPAFIWLIIHFQLEELYLYLSTLGLFLSLMNTSGSHNYSKTFLICLFSFAASFGKVIGPIIVLIILLGYLLSTKIDNKFNNPFVKLNIITMTLMSIAGGIFHFYFFSITSSDTPSIERFRGVLFEYLSCSGVALVAVVVFYYQIIKERITSDVILFGAMICSGCIYLLALAIGWKSSIYHAAVPDGIFILYLLYFITKSTDRLTTIAQYWIPASLIGVIIFLLPKLVLYAVTIITLAVALVISILDRSNFKKKLLFKVSGLTLLVSVFSYWQGFNISLMYPISAIVIYLIMANRSENLYKTALSSATFVVSAIYVIKALTLAYTAIYSGTTILKLTNSHPNALLQFTNNAVAPDSQCHIAYLVAKQAKFINPKSQFKVDAEHCTSSHFYAHHDLPSMLYDKGETMPQSTVYVTNLQDTYLFKLNSIVKQYPVGLFVLK